MTLKKKKSTLDAKLNQYIKTAEKISFDIKFD